MIAGSSGEGNVVPQQDWVPDDHVALLREKIVIFGL